MDKIENACFIAPSTGLKRCDEGALNNTLEVIEKRLGVDKIYLSPFLFSENGKIDHVAGTINERLADFKKAIREFDLIISVAGGTGAEDIALKISREDFDIIARRKPIIVGFSDFTFLLNEIYYSSGAPVVHFTPFALGKGSYKKVFELIHGKDIFYQGSKWLTAPPARQFGGIPIGGNLSTFVNFLSRANPVRIDWEKYILFIEDVGIDKEDLHRLLEALRRHNVFAKIKCVVIGLFCDFADSERRNKQKEFLKFFKNYIGEYVKKSPPILAVSNLGHGIVKNLMAMPIGGYATISKSKKIVFQLEKPEKTKPF